MVSLINIEKSYAKYYCNVFGRQSHMCVKTTGRKIKKEQNVDGLKYLSSISTKYLLNLWKILKLA